MRYLEDDHEPGCGVFHGAYDGGPGRPCDCVQGARAALASAESRAAAKRAEEERARKPIDDAYARGRSDERSEWEARVRALEDKVASMSMGRKSR